MEVGGQRPLERDNIRARATRDAMDGGREGECEPERESPDRGTRQNRKAPDSSTHARETERGHGRSRESERGTGRKIAPESQRKVVEMGLDL